MIYEPNLGPKERDKDQGYGMPFQNRMDLKNGWQCNEAGKGA